jgi:hypothetical protein
MKQKDSCIATIGEFLGDEMKHSSTDAKTNGRKQKKETGNEESQRSMY